MLTLQLRCTVSKLRKLWLNIRLVVSLTAHPNASLSLYKFPMAFPSHHSPNPSILLPTREKGGTKILRSISVAEGSETPYFVFLKYLAQILLTRLSENT